MAGYRDGADLDPAQIRTINVELDGDGTIQTAEVKVRIDHDIDHTGTNDPSTHVVTFDVTDGVAVFHRANRKHGRSIATGDSDQLFVGYRTIPAVLAAERALIERTSVVEKVVGIQSRIGSFAENVALQEVQD